MSRSFTLWLLPAALLPVPTAWTAVTCWRYEALGTQDRYGLFQDGDIVLGGLFPLYNQPILQDVKFTRLPKVQNCVR